MALESLSTREVTLIVVRDSELRGSIGPLKVSTPWWQDIEPIARLFPQLVVLRLLDVHAPAGATSGGAVRYLAEAIGPNHPGGVKLDTLDLAAVPEDLTLHDDPLRMPWAKPGGPDLDLEWVASLVEITGAPVQHRTWNLSAIWSVPTADGEVWLKCLPPFLSHEGLVLAALADQAVPRLLGRDAHRLLLGPMPGRDGYDATLEDRKALIDALLAIQLTTTNRIQTLLTAGVPDRRWSALLDAARAVVVERAPEDARLRSLVDHADARVQALLECGLDDVLAHTDAHPGNARIGQGVGSPIWFDWGDSAIGSPLLDLAVLDRPGTGFADELTDYWLGSWQRARPDSEPHRAWELARPLASLLGAVVYQRFLDGIERSERVYHDADVPACLRRAADLVHQEA